MSIPDQIALAAARLLRHQAQGYAGRALRLAQRGAGRAAAGIDSAGPRILALTQAGLKLTEVSCRCVDELVKQSLASAEGALTDSAERLRMSARAESLGSLYAEQRATLPVSRARVGQELRATWSVVSATGRELVQIAQSARKELLRRDRPPRAAAPAPARRTRAPKRKRAARRPERPAL